MGKYTSSEYRQNENSTSADYAADALRLTEASGEWSADQKLPWDQHLLISAVSGGKRVRETSTIFPSIIVVEATTPAQLLNKLKQLRWNQWSSAFSYWISQSPCLWCLSSILLLVRWNMAYVPRSWRRRQLWGKKALLQTCYQYFCKGTSLPAVLGAALVCYLKQGTQSLPVMTLSTHCYPQSPICHPVKPSFHPRKYNWISFATNFWLASY